MMEFQTFFISSENHSRVFRRCTNSCRCPKFPSRLMYLQFVFPSRVVSGGLARCLLMCISRRLDDQRVIGAVGEGTESMGGAGRRLITNLRWRHDIAPARYISKTPSPFQRHTTVQYWFTCNCAWVHGAENVKKKVKQTVCDRWQEFWSWWAGTWTKQESHY